MNETLNRLRDCVAQDRPGAWGLLLRHAERPEITDPALALELGLTDEGRVAAVAMGRALAETGLELGPALSSPIGRCLDTAACLLQGAAGLDAVQAKAGVKVERELAEATTADGEQVVHQFMTRNPYELILEQLEDTPNLGFRTVADGAERLLAAMRPYLEPGKLALFVSHDALIMTLQRHYLGRRFTLERWMPFLEGSVLYAHGDTVELDGAALEIGR